MQFKVGDKVRLTRDCLWAKILAGAKIDKQEVFWFLIEKMDNSVITSPYPNYHESVIELVPEEPEFEFGEEIEVRDQIGEKRKRVIFLCKTTANDTHQYITADISKKSFDNGALFCNTSWRFARKAPPQLTRKEVAEKFWVSEDFELIEK